MRKTSILGFALLALVACSPTCTEETRVIEVVWGGVTEDMSRYSLHLASRQGFTCRRDGEIRNAFGASIGTRHVCTRCV